MIQKVLFPSKLFSVFQSYCSRLSVGLLFYDSKSTLFRLDGWKKFGLVLGYMPTQWPFFVRKKSLCLDGKKTKQGLKKSVRAKNKPCWIRGLEKGNEYAIYAIYTFWLVPRSLSVLELLFGLLSKGQPVQFFLSHPVVLESICYCTRVKWLINVSKTTGGLQNI